MTTQYDIILGDQKNFKDIIEAITEINFNESLMEIEKNIAILSAKELYSPKVTRVLGWKYAASLLMQKVNTNERLLTKLINMIDETITEEEMYSSSNLLMEILIYNISINNQLFMINPKYVAAANIYEPTLDNIPTAKIRDLLISILSATKEDLEKELYNNIMSLEFLNVSEEDFTVPQRYDGFGSLFGNKNFPIATFDEICTKICSNKKTETFNDMSNNANANIYKINMCYGLKSTKSIPIYHPEVLNIIKKSADAVLIPKLLENVKVIEYQTGEINVEHPCNEYLVEGATKNIILLYYGQDENIFHAESKLFMLLFNSAQEFLLSNEDIYFMKTITREFKTDAQSAVLDEALSIIKHNEFIKKHLGKISEITFNFIRFKDIIKKMEIDTIPITIETYSENLDLLENYILSELHIKTNYANTYAHIVAVKIYNELVVRSNESDIENIFNDYLRSVVDLNAK